MVPTRWRCRTRYRPRMSLYQSVSPTWMQSLALVCDDAKYNSSQYVAALVWNGRHEKSCTAHESCQTSGHRPPIALSITSSWQGRYTLFQYNANHPSYPYSCLYPHPESGHFIITLQLSAHVHSVLAQIPVGLQESVFQLVNQDTRLRPQARALVQITYFGWGVQYQMVKNTKLPTYLKIVRIPK